MRMEMSPGQRAFVGAALPGGFLLATAAPYLLWRDELPDPIAVHFDAHGAANGSMPAWGHLLLIAAFTVPAASVLAWAAWRRRSSLGFEAAIAAFVGWLLAVLNVMVLHANRGVADWHDATLGAGAAWGATLSAVGVAIPVALMVRVPPVAPSTEGAQPATPLRTGERVAWFGRSQSLLLVIVALALVAVGTLALVNLGIDGAFGGFVLFAAALSVVALTSVDVEITDDGVRARGPMPFPRVRLPLESVEAARAVDFTAMGRTDGHRWTGWGYRGSLRLFGWAGWVLRDGPALALDLSDGRRFLVTVDGADEAAALVNGLLARRRDVTTPAG